MINMEFDLNNVKGIEDLSAEQYRKLINELENTEHDEEYSYRIGFDGFDFLYYQSQGEIILL